MQCDLCEDSATVEVKMTHRRDGTECSGAVNLCPGDLVPVLNEVHMCFAHKRAVQVTVTKRLTEVTR